MSKEEEILQLVVVKTLSKAMKWKLPVVENRVFGSSEFSVLVSDTVGENLLFFVGKGVKDYVFFAMQGSDIFLLLRASEMEDKYIIRFLYDIARKTIPDEMFDPVTNALNNIESTDDTTSLPSHPEQEQPSGPSIT